MTAPMIQRIPAQAVRLHMFQDEDSCTLRYSMKTDEAGEVTAIIVNPKQGGRRRAAPQRSAGTSWQAAGDDRAGSSWQASSPSDPRQARRSSWTQHADAGGDVSDDEETWAQPSWVKTEEAPAEDRRWEFDGQAPKQEPKQEPEADEPWNRYGRWTAPKKELGATKQEFGEGEPSARSQTVVGRLLTHFPAPPKYPPDFVPVHGHVKNESVKNEDPFWH
ncbi:unnamed protein product [Polarella glacialis]|uniref:Uncharacterized protein n=1 Tax=Polarella glacialis TaxID=89957 RepID=A0A813ECK2_POLGL|nr:unnamed protein product [Polarella glacialis]